MKDKLTRSLINIENFNESDVYFKLKVGSLKTSYTEGDIVIPEGDYLNYIFLDHGKIIAHILDHYM